MKARRPKRSIRQGYVAATASTMPLSASLSAAGELKYYGYDMTGGAFPSVSTTVSTVALGALVAAGSGVNQRIGSTIIPKAIRVLGTIVGGQSNSVSDDNRNVVRLSLILGVVGTAPSGYTCNTILDPRFTTGVVRVLWDRVLVLQSPGKDSTGYMPSSKEVRVRVPIRVGPLLYSGTAANTIKGQELYFCVVSDSSAIPNPGFVNGSTLDFEFADH